MKERPKDFEFKGLAILPVSDGFKVYVTIERDGQEFGLEHEAETPPVALGYAQHALMGWEVKPAE